MSEPEAASTAREMPPPEVLLLKAAEAAAVLGMSRGKFLQLDNQGAVPEPVRFGKAVRWPRSELGAWVNAGCPARAAWKSRKERLTSA
jgi:predicted DNA-binding transcriptional regulator AlpA